MDGGGWEVKEADGLGRGVGGGGEENEEKGSGFGGVT